MVMIPLHMQTQRGMRPTVFPKELWEKIRNNDQVDESKLKQFTLAFTLCHPAGCTAEIESSPELISYLRTSGGLLVRAKNTRGTTISFPIPLNGFEQAYLGPPLDNKKYNEARKALMQQIEARSQQKQIGKK
jgi:hypothetical protein